MKLVRESLFSSTLRSFCISFFAVIGIVLAFVLVMLVFGAGKSAKTMETSTFDVIIPDSNGRKYSVTSHEPLLLRIDIVGPIMPDGVSPFAPNGVGIEYIRTTLNESRMGLLKNNRVKGILLFINSPGGAGYLCEPIYTALKEYSIKHQVPIYAYVEGMCASAGMYIACAADKIYANNTSMIGSVGAFWNFFNVSGGMEKVGVQNMTLKAGKGKNAMNPFQPWAEGDSDNYQDILNQDYEQFVSVVAASRPKLTKDLLINTYGAQVFVSPDAEKYGYIDGAGYQYNQVVQMLAQEAGLKKGDYQLVQMQAKVKFSDLFSLSNSFQTQAKLVEAIKQNPFSFLSPNPEGLAGALTSPPTK